MSSTLPVLTVDPDAATPVAAQLTDAVRAAVACGALGRGDRLPPVRTLAVELDLAPNTVAKAYRELEAEGLLEGRGRAGTFVAADAQDARAQARRAAREYVDAVVVRLGLSAPEAVAFVRAEAAGRPD